MAARDGASGYGSAYAASPRPERKIRPFHLPSLQLNDSLRRRDSSADGSTTSSDLAIQAVPDPMVLADIKPVLKVHILAMSPLSALMSFSLRPEGNCSLCSDLVQLDASPDAPVDARPPPPRRPRRACAHTYGNCCTRSAARCTDAPGAQALTALTKPGPCILNAHFGRVDPWSQHPRAPATPCSSALPRCTPAM